MTLLRECDDPRQGIDPQERRRANRESLIAPAEASRYVAINNVVGLACLRTSLLHRLTSSDLLHSFEHDTAEAVDSTASKIGLRETLLRETEKMVTN